jgi:fatty-acyl-CoA synthase
MMLRCSVDKTNNIAISGYKMNRDSIIDSLIKASSDNKSELLFMPDHKRLMKYSYKDIWNGSLSFAENVNENGLRYGECVIIVLPTCVEFQFSFYGTLLAGGIPVPVATPPVGVKNINYYIERIEAILDNSKAKIIVASQNDIETFKEILNIDDKEYKFIDINSINYMKETSFNFYNPKLDDICFIQYTSGSTNNKPKGVPITHENVLENIEGVGKSIEVTERERGLSWMPLYHDMGLIGGMILPLHYQFEKMIFLAPILLAKPIFWLKAISDYRATICPGNNFAFSHCVKKVSEEEKKSLDLSSWRIAFNGSEPIDIKIINAFSEKFQSVGYNRNAMFPCYGLAEATLGVTLPVLGQEPYIAEFNHEKLYFGSKVELYNKGTEAEKSPVKLLALGKPIDCLDIGIFDQDGNNLGENYVGRICVKGNSVMNGYYSDQEHTQEAIKNGWLITGDIGFLYEGNLYFVGREKELVVIRGKNYSAVDIESVVKNIVEPELNCAAFGYLDSNKGRECLGVVFETNEKDLDKLDIMKKVIQKKIMSNFGIYADKINNIPSKSIPKTINGKIRRIECTRLYGGS